MIAICDQLGVIAKVSKDDVHMVRDSRSPMTHAVVVTSAEER